MRKRLVTMAFGISPLLVSSVAMAAGSVSGNVAGEPSPHPTIDLRWTTSLAGTVLVNPVRFPTHRGFVVLHISEHQSDPKATPRFTLAVDPHCVELARKITSEKVIITPFDDGVCTLTVSDQSGNAVSTELYVGAQAIAKLPLPPTPAPVPSPTSAPSPAATSLRY